MRYKIGDKVRVRKDLKVGESYGVYFNEDMVKFIGEEVTIDWVGSLGYRIKEDNLSWSWTDKMFEDFKYNYKKGTKLRRINDHGKYFNIGTIITLSKDILSNDMYENVYCEEIKESVGIISNYEEVKEDIMDDVMRSIYNSKLKYEDGIFFLVSNPSVGIRVRDYIEVKGGNQMTDIETLKSFNPKNLSEGKRQAEEEKDNYEASEAKKAYTALINQKEELERIIKTTNEELKKVKESLAVFK